MPTPHPQRRIFSHFRHARKVALFFVCCVIGWVRDLGRGSPGRLEDAPLQCTAPVLAAEPMFEGTHKAHNDPENWISAAAHAKDLQAAAKPGTYVKLFLMIRHGEGEKIEHMHIVCCKLEYRGASFWSQLPSTSFLVAATADNLSRKLPPLCCTSSGTTYVSLPLLFNLQWVFFSGVSSGSQRLSVIAYRLSSAVSSLYY